MRCLRAPVCEQQQHETWGYVPIYPSLLSQCCRMSLEVHLSSPAIIYGVPAAHHFLCTATPQSKVSKESHFHSNWMTRTEPKPKACPSSWPRGLFQMSICFWKGGLPRIHSQYPLARCFSVSYLFQRIPDLLGCWSLPGCLGRESLGVGPKRNSNARKVMFSWNVLLLKSPQTPL